MHDPAPKTLMAYNQWLIRGLASIRKTECAAKRGAIPANVSTS